MYVCSHGLSMYCPCGVNPASNVLMTGNLLIAWRVLFFGVVSIYICSSSLNVQQNVIYCTNLHLEDT